MGDLYLSIAELDDFMGKSYTGTELAEVGYSGVSDEDKTVLMRRCQGVINGFRYRGSKVDKAQPNAFPRLINGSEVYPTVSLGYCIADLVYTMLSHKNSVLSAYANSGLKKVSLGKMSYEFFSEGANEAVLDERVKVLLSSYIMVVCVPRGGIS